MPPFPVRPHARRKKDLTRPPGSRSEWVEPLSPQALLDPVVGPFPDPRDGTTTDALTVLQVFLVHREVPVDVLTAGSGRGSLFVSTGEVQMWLVNHRDARLSPSTLVVPVEPRRPWCRTSRTRRDTRTRSPSAGTWGRTNIPTPTTPVIPDTRSTGDERHRRGLSLRTDNTRSRTGPRVPSRAQSLRGVQSPW